MKVLIVYASFGTGHKRAAEALEHELKNRDKSIVVENIDIITYSRPILNKLQNVIAKFLSTKLRKFRFRLYKNHMYSNMDKPSLFVNLCVFVWWTKKLKKLLKDFDADLIISTQAAPTELVARKKAEIGNPKIASVFTDYGLHRYHLLSQKYIDYYFLPTYEIKQQLMDYGVDESKIFISGIPISKEFNPNLYKNDDIIEKYNFPKDEPLFLFVAGGGLGFDNSLPYFEELLKIDLPFYYIFVSGKNKGLKQQAEIIAKRYNKRGKVLGYTHDMPKLLNVCNLMIGKPGGLITTECIEMNVPICAVEPIPGQELKNVDFIVNNNFGIYPQSTTDFRNSMGDILQNKQLLQEMKKHLEEYKIKQGVEEIANILLKNNGKGYKDYSN